MKPTAVMQWLPVRMSYGAILAHAKMGISAMEQIAKICVHHQTVGSGTMQPANAISNRRLKTAIIQSPAFLME